jgi:hypothetical protein
MGCCGTTNAADMTVLVNGQTAGDCQKLVCDGNGASKSIADDSDVPTDMDSCHVGSCNAGTPKQTQKQKGATCALGGGVNGVCTAGGTCVECNTSNDCTDPQKPVCNASNVCVAATCTDNMKDGAETDIDCGGPLCMKCDDGKACSAANGSDCKSGVCDSGTKTCKAPSCTDGVKNGNELGTDCGGDCLLASPAKTCPNGTPCNTGSDCTSTVCNNNVCGTLNLGLTCSTDIQCGSSHCVSAVCCDTAGCNAPKSCNGSNQFVGAQTCPAGSGMCNTPTPVTCTPYVCKATGTGCPTTCAGDNDCTTGNFCDATNKCVAKLADGATCTGNTQCTSGFCSGKCFPASCNNGTKDGTETDTDCGGASCPTCANGKTCNTGTDCTSTNCVDVDAGQKLCQ